MGWIQTKKERVEAESPAEWEKRELPDCKQSKASVGNCKTVSICLLRVRVLCLGVSTAPLTLLKNKRRE